VEIEEAVKIYNRIIVIGKLISYLCIQVGEGLSLKSCNFYNKYLTVEYTNYHVCGH